MKLTLDELRKSKAAALASNAHLFVGAVEKPVPQRDALQSLDRRPKTRQGGSVRLVICLVRYARRLLDDDNLAGGFKPLRDAVAASLGIDDGDRRIRWEYAQVETRGQQGTAVKIEVL